MWTIQMTMWKQKSHKLCRLKIASFVIETFMMDFFVKSNKHPELGICNCCGRGFCISVISVNICLNKLETVGWIAKHGT